MSRTLRTITAVILVAIITFGTIILCQKVGASLRLDVTEQRLYTLSDATKAVLAKLNQPLTLKLYFAKTATQKAPDQIRFYTNYYHFVKALLDEYVRASGGMVRLELIDPRPFSDEEEDALRYGLRRFPITEEENFFFGLVLQTQFGVVKTIPFFSPQRQNFVEYDISHLIDTAITRQKKRIGILSSLPVMGEDASGYMAQLRRMRGERPRPPWTIIQHLRQQYDVNEVPKDTEQIKDVDILLVIHPKDLPEKTLFAIDQYVIRGGRTIIFEDPRCFSDDTTRDPFGRMQSEPVSNLNKLTRKWGVEMLEDCFAGDRSLAIPVRIERNDRLQKLIGYLELTAPSCFNQDNVVTANLNQVRMLFAGALVESTPADPNQAAGRQIIPLLQTTNRGNTWSVEGPWEWIRINPEAMMKHFTDGTEPVVMGYLIKGRLKSNFPDGIEITEEKENDKAASDANAPEKKTITRKLTGLAESTDDCAVMVFSDVDFISNIVAYQETIFGMSVPVGNNSDLVFNALEDLSGSGSLIGIRSRGNFTRPFTVVDAIRSEAEKKYAQEVAELNAEIKRLQDELQQVVSSAKKGQEELVKKSIIDKERDLRLRIRQTQARLREVQRKRYEKIEKLGKTLQNLNMWSAPGVILAIAVVLAIRRSVLRRRYVSHASDAG